jgi:hypothetical protein
VLDETLQIRGWPPASLLGGSHLAWGLAERRARKGVEGFVLLEVAGIHDSVMFYGGRLLSQLTGEETDTLDVRGQQFIDPRPINRNMAIVIDRDTDNRRANIQTTKSRVLKEFRKDGGFGWSRPDERSRTTSPAVALASAAKSSHPQAAKKWQAPENEYTKPLDGIPNPEKIKIAENAIRDEPIWDRLELKTQVAGLVDFFNSANT